MNQEIKEILGFDEVVDTAVDVIETAQILADALKDGFQITDLVTLIGVAPKAQEIAKDGRLAISQLLDLTADEADEAVAAIAKRTASNPATIVVKVNEAFTLIARTYRQVTNIRNLVRDYERFGKTLTK
jgi:hypothetical protein